MFKFLAIILAAEAGLLAFAFETPQVQADPGFLNHCALPLHQECSGCIMDHWVEFTALWVCGYDEIGTGCEMSEVYCGKIVPPSWKYVSGTNCKVVDQMSMFRITLYAMGCGKPK